MPDYPQPLTCVLHEDRLKKIEDTVESIHDDVQTLLGYDGPIGGLKEQVGIIDGSTRRAHERIDVIEHDSKAEARRLNALAVKVGGIAAILSTFAATVIGHFLK